MTDSMAGHFLSRGAIEAVVVGADRIAANGDVANKIGTYSLAVLAKENGVPFYVAAPTTTIDLACPDGAAIPIEERAPGEVLSFRRAVDRARRRLRPPRRLRRHAGALRHGDRDGPGHLPAALRREPPGGREP